MTSPKAKIRILYVTRTLPCPPSQGSHLRILNIGRNFQQYADVTFLYAGPQPDADRVAATKLQFPNLIIMPTLEKKLSGFLETHRYRFKFHWPWYHSNKVSHGDRKRFAELCNEHDVVWFHTLAPADSFGQYRFANSVIDLDDLNHVKFSQRVEMERALRARIAAQILAYKWRRWEMRALDRFTLVNVCSEEDKGILGGSDRIHVIPNGFERPANQPVWKACRNMRLGFIGLLDYAPNAYGLKWFGENVWPLILKELPDASVRIIGRIPEKNSFQDYPRFESLGFLPDTFDEFATWSAMIVPLHFGGGTRLKILDAFSKMCPVVSTSVGAHGLGVTDNRNVLLADDPASFARACIRLLQEPDQGQVLATDGWDFFEKLYTWEAIGPQIEGVVRKATGEDGKP